jgi:hypothetical protein
MNILVALTAGIALVIVVLLVAMQYTQEYTRILEPHLLLA